jgi:hypothetical protein
MISAALVRETSTIAVRSSSLFRVGSTRRPTSSVIAGSALGSSLNTNAVVATVVSRGGVVDRGPVGMATTR